MLRDDDDQKLNSIAYKDSYPLPLIGNCLKALMGSFCAALWIFVGITTTSYRRSGQRQVCLCYPKWLLPVHSNAIRFNMRTVRLLTTDGCRIMRPIVPGVLGLPR